MGVRTLIIATVLALATGLWAGDAWRQGRTAMAQQKADRQAIEDLKTTAETLRQHAVDASLAYDQASERMGAIAQQLETDREANRQFEQQQRAQLAQLLEARPGLRNVRVGADLLRHWQQSNAGSAGAATAATASPASQPAHAVPAATQPRR